MTRFALPLVAATSLAALSAGAAQAATIEIATTGPVIELQVSETLKAKPDIATIGAGVTSMAPTASEAMAANARDMNAVIKQIKALGIDEDDVQTSRISLYAQYDYDRESQKQVFRGYQASNQVSVVLRDLDKAGKVLDALVRAGATDLSGPDFAIDDDTQVKAAARKAALERAYGQAREYAEFAGYKGVRLLEISEAIHSSQPLPMNTRMVMADAKAEMSTPIQAGVVGSTVNISVKFEMTQ